MGKGRIGGWFQLSGSGAIPSATGGLVVDVGATMETDLGRMFAGDTVVRMRGLVTWTPASLTPADIRVFIVKVRKGLVTGDLDDFDTSGVEFMWAHERRWVPTSWETASGVFGLQPLYIELDTKAKRIINNGETLYMVAYGSSGGHSVFTRGRMLLKLR